MAVGEHAAVAGADRLAAEHVALAARRRGVVVDGHGAQHRLRRLVPLRDVGVPADEVGGLDLGPLHARLDDRALAVELEAVRAVALLDAAGGAVHADADGHRAIGLARLVQQVPQPGALLHRHVELPAQLADVGDPGGEHRQVAELDGAAGQEREAGVRDVVVGEAAEDVAGLRPPQPDRGERRGLVDDLGVAFEVVGEPLEVGHAVRAARDDAVAVVRQAHHREVGAEAALGVEHRRVDHAALADLGLRHDDLLHRLRRTGPDDVEDRERGQVHDARALAHREVLRVDDGRPPAGVPLVLARHHGVAVLTEQGLVRAVPHRPLPADGLEEHRARGLLGGVHRRERACRARWPTARRGARCRRSC